MIENALEGLNAGFYLFGNRFFFLFEAHDVFARGPLGGLMNCGMRKIFQDNKDLNSKYFDGTGL